jgi:hypothetical protein
VLIQSNSQAAIDICQHRTRQRNWLHWRGYAGFIRYRSSEQLVGADQLHGFEQHCLRADKVYSKWAYQDIVDYHFPKE